MKPKFENIESDEGSSFLCQLRSSKSFMEDHSWHFHPEYELLWIVKSQGSRFVGDSINHFQAGDLVLLGPNIPHCWVDDSPPCDDNGDDEPPEWILVQFSKNCFGSGFLDLSEAALIRKLLERSHRGLHITGQAATQVADLLKTLVEQRRFPRLITLMQILHLLSQSDEINELTSQNYRLDSDIKERDSKRIEKAHRYIHENIDKQISQADVASIIGLTPEAFSRFFKKATGLTFVNFVNVVRISKACSLLNQNEADISDIAYRCGYQNISNFNRQFLKRKNMTPGQYREMHRTLGD
jgi:AraC-like DNA-binding protein